MRGVNDDALGVESGTDSEPDALTALSVSNTPLNMKKNAYIRILITVCYLFVNILERHEDQKVVMYGAPANSICMDINQEKYEQWHY